MYPPFVFLRKRTIFVVHNISYSFNVFVRERSAGMLAFLDFFTIFAVGLNLKL